MKFFLYWFCITIWHNFTVPTDEHPQLRKLSWSFDNTFLAIARDNGIINVYNILGCIVATIQPVSIQVPFIILLTTEKNEKKCYK